MKKLIQQFLKLGVVGVICFFIDTGLYTICNLIGIDSSVKVNLTFYDIAQQGEKVNQNASKSA